MERAVRMVVPKSNLLFILGAFMQRNKGVPWVAWVVVAAIFAMPSSMFGATRSTTSKGTAKLVYFGEGSNRAAFAIPFLIPMEVTTTATYTTKYDSKLRKTVVVVSKTDQSVSLRGAKNIPCGIDMSVSTKVYENRTSLYRTMKRTSTGSTNGSYLVSSTTLITGFVNTRAFSLYRPRLETVGSVGAWECTGWRKITNRLDLP